MRLRDLFKVETLDVRFGSKTSPPGTAVADARPSKWNTPEFYVYYVFFLTIPALMFKSVYDVSQPAHPGYQKFENLLDDFPRLPVIPVDATTDACRWRVPTASKWLSGYELHLGCI